MNFAEYNAVLHWAAKIVCTLILPGIEAENPKSSEKYTNTVLPYWAP